MKITTETQSGKGEEGKARKPEGERVCGEAWNMKSSFSL
jgi:hypothetical protein